MNRKFLPLLLLLCWAHLLAAKPVDPDKALNIASSYFTGLHGAKGQGLRARPLQLVYTSQSQQSNPQARQKPTNYYYVFNAGTAGGFVIVAADDNASPIIGYADAGTYDPENLPPHVAKWMEGYRREIRHIIENEVEATPQIKAAWQQLQTGNPLSAAATQAVPPLLATRWDQSPHYNDLCPRDATRNNEQTVTGCVATAMAQVMKYWNYPASGTGFHSYNHPKFGTLSANFGGTTYNWGAMPSEVSGPNSAVATLMYQVGVSVNMSYGVGATGGSSAYVISDMSQGENCSEYALKKHFGYDASTMRGVQRRSYTTTEWVQLLKTELNAKRPILYAGFGSGGGHAFVCDGYDTNNFFHMNWGWGGVFDGYFSISALNPNGVGTGGGNGGYNSGHQALIGIQPPPDNGNGGNGGQSDITLSLYAPVTPSKGTILYGESFSVSTNLVASAGTGSFKGDYAAAVFDRDLTFVDFIQIYTDNDLPAGNRYVNNLVFESEGLLSLLPGEYKIGIFSRKTGGDWTQAANAGANTNMVPLKVVNPNTLELYNSLSVTGGPTLRRGQPVEVSLDVANFGTTDFNGIFDLSLYNLEGQEARVIETMTVEMGPNTHFDPLLVFSNAKLDVEPGTYYLALMHKSTSGEWELTGSTHYANPIRVVVQEPEIVADAYEANDEQSQAYLLPLRFDGNTSSVLTPGANSHLGADNDFYKVELPAGYTYTVRARVHDSYNSGNGQSYTNDVLFSILQGTTWSDSYDDVMPSDLTIEGGETLILRVAPYFQGETGTYLLDLQVTRSTLTAVEDPVLEQQVQLYPNPAQDHVQLRLDPAIRSIQSLRIFDITGREVHQQAQPARIEVEQGLSVQHLPEGIYVLTMETNAGIWRKKFLIKR